MTPPDSSALLRFQGLDESSSSFTDQLYDLLSQREHAQSLQNLKRDDSASLIDCLDNALGFVDPSSLASQKCIQELRNLCSSMLMLPKSYALPSRRILEVDSTPLMCGGFSKVYKGTLDGSSVCIKRVHISDQDTEQEMTETFCREAVTWKHLEHPNILSLLGITTNPFQLVSKWVSGGNLLEYIQKHPDADRLKLLRDVAEGLRYLHSRGVIHGNLKSANILVENSGEVRITDFGLSTIAGHLDSQRGVPFQSNLDFQWIAPEVREKGEYSEKADVFSFAMVIIEAFTGAIPFSDCSPLESATVMVRSEHPSRPTHPAVTDAVWTLMQRCWNPDPQLRPEISQISQALTLNPSSWERLIDPTLSTNERIDLITSIFSTNDEIKKVKSLSRDDVQAFVDMMDEISVELDKLPPAICRRCLRVLYRVCGREALIPKSLRIPVCYDSTQRPQSSSEFSDVWKGNHDGREVAAKATRVNMTNDLKAIRKRFCKEVSAWRSLRHPNVLPLLAVTMEENRFVIMSEWMKNGNIINFLKGRNVDRLQLLVDVAKALAHVHGLGIVHGNIKGRNILVDDSGRALLAGFSRIAFIPDQPTFESGMWTDGDSVRWTSPELIDSEKFKLPIMQQTKESDCYALGMVAYEVLSGCAPFGTDGTFPIIRKVLNGEHPQRPQGKAGRLVTDGIWDVLKSCWKTDPKERASAQEILQRLEGNYPIVGEGDDQWDDLSTDPSHDDPDVGRKDPGSPALPDGSQPPVRTPDFPPGVSQGPAVPGPPPGSLQAANMHRGWIRNWVGYVTWGILSSVIGYFGGPSGR